VKMLVQFASRNIGQLTYLYCLSLIAQVTAFCVDT
jgi:hypothetical protein